MLNNDVTSKLTAPNRALVAGLGRVTWPHSLAALLLVFLTGCGGVMPKQIGLVDGQLAQCPDSPNCVLSQGAQDEQHAIAPISYSGAPLDAKAALERVLAESPRTKIKNSTEYYIHAEFTSAIFRFVDDVEFLIEPASESAGVIHVRSASRVGYSDLGANRKRVEKLRAAFDTAN